MTTVYVLLPGTPVAVSRGGLPFKPQTLRKQFQFDGPAVTTFKTMTFTAGGR